MRESSDVRSHDRAVLIVAIVVLPWVALSRVGEWRISPSDRFEPDRGGLQALTSRAVVTSDRLLFSVGGRRADGTRNVFTTPPSGVTNVPLLLPGSGNPFTRLGRHPDAFALLPTSRGPPVMVSA